ncbi:MAG TPA: serine/threonine-protein kinase [Rhizomicrobium sp.]|jgi:serine/threonine protein kinase|nr:serine/threonine-protein kinase [Rhizomicrobium sp.]
MSPIHGRSEFIRSHDPTGTAYALHKCLNARVTGQFNDDQFVQAVRGTCTEQEFIDAVSKQLRTAPESTPGIIGLIDRLYKRGEVSLAIVRALESRISRGGLRSANDGVTIDLTPHGEPGGFLMGRPTPPPVDIGTVLRDRYVIEKRLGYGGSGTVFRALDRYRGSLPQSQRYVAVKILHGRPGSREETVDSLRLELQCAQTLSHQNIVKVFDFDRDGDIDFFTMELLDGELLSDLMARFHPLPMSRAHAWWIIGQIASGLEHAHERRIVHADLKPQNIMITNAGEVRILDFGAARSLASLHGSRSASSATSAYACCELLDGRAPDPRDDMYALACIAYELLTGEHPFQRRRASDARDFGVVPVRPPGLRRRQWITLAKSLSWHRAGRSISVRDWSKGLQPRPERTQRLPGIGHLTPAPLKAPPAPSFRASAVLTMLVITAVVWMLFTRLAPGGKVSGEALSGAAQGPAASANLAAPLPPPAAPATVSRKQSNAPAQPAGGGVALSRNDYHVQPGQHFAEIRIHRPANWRGDKPLLWWTEAASAKPGLDYVQQPKVQQAFPKGKNSMSFFVKLLPRAARTRPDMFYVAVADQGAAERGPDRVEYTAVRLP